MGNINELFSTIGITDSVRMLHTPGEFAKKNLLYVQEVGRLKSLQPHKSQRESLDSFLFLGVLSGEGLIYIGENEYKVKRGLCALINCNHYYAHMSSVEKPWELIWVHFNGYAAQAYYELFTERNGQKNIFKPNSLKDMQSYIETLMLYQKDKDLEAELESGNILLQLLNASMMSVIHQEDAKQDQNKKICKEIRESVNEKYQLDNLLSLFEEKYEIEIKQLDNCFLKTYGITLQDYILNRRFTAAKELLRFTIKPIKEIIEESGINNEDQFRKLFQSSENMTAEDYRMKWAQWVK